MVVELVPGLLSIEGLSIKLADGASPKCSYSSSEEAEGLKIHRYSCEEASASVAVKSLGNGFAIAVEAESLTPLDPYEALRLHLGAPEPQGLLALTLHPGEARRIYSPAFRYYPRIAVDKKPEGPRPPDTVDYPGGFGEISHREFTRGYPCWTYHYFPKSFDELAQYNVYVLSLHGDRYLALATFSNGDATAYIERGPSARVVVGVSTRSVKRSWILAAAYSEDPYDATRLVVEAAASVGAATPRWRKPRPRFIDRLGWCSWNALLTLDLSHENVVRIVRGLIERGIPIRWVIIDDGWQVEEKRSVPHILEARVMKRFGVDKKRFPEGFSALIKELKGLGIEDVGLWHTINIHWGGVYKHVLEALGAEGYRIPWLGTYVPHPAPERATEIYTSLYRWVKEQGFSIVKVDNQWVIHTLYQGDEKVGEAARNIELALQLAAQGSGIEILNCMSMAPENYSNFVLSNAMRVSMDYIPFWKADAKLHTLFSVYNSLFFSNIAYPDYDMWMSYDPYAMVHAVARVLSGGPIYITDRHPHMTNAELLKRIALPSGEAVRVDEPGLPTKDILFADPYNEEKLLKIAAPIKWAYAIGVINVHREGKSIRDTIRLDQLPWLVKHEEFAYYMVNSGRKGVVRRGEAIDIELRELEADVVILAPIVNERTVIGIKEYLLPPYPVDLLEERIAKTRVDGTLLIYADGSFQELKARRDEFIEL